MRSPRFAKPGRRAKYGFKERYHMEYLSELIETFMMGMILIGIAAAVRH